jgi:Flp pilus assembly pilin Flp
MPGLVAQRKVRKEHCLAKFVADESGATAVEYAMIAVVIGVPLLAMAVTLRDGLVGLLTDVANRIADVVAGE